MKTSFVEPSFSVVDRGIGEKIYLTVFSEAIYEVNSFIAHLLSLCSKQIHPNISL